VARIRLLPGIAKPFLLGVVGMVPLIVGSVFLALAAAFHDLRAYMRHPISGRHGTPH
jgi:hypothetical protein